MSLQDPLSDLFSRIRNAQMRYKPIVSSPVSKLRQEFQNQVGVFILALEGYRMYIMALEFQLFQLRKV